jgi:hypothetical protein
MCGVLCLFDGPPIQAVFWLAWGSATTGRILLQFAEQETNMLRQDYVLVNLKLETALGAAS